MINGSAVINLSSRALKCAFRKSQSRFLIACKRLVKIWTLSRPPDKRA